MTVNDYMERNSGKCQKDALDILERLVGRLFEEDKTPQEITAHVSLVGSAILGTVLFKCSSKDTEEECLKGFSDLTLGFSDHLRAGFNRNSN
jgi:hypothetical protein